MIKYLDNIPGMIKKNWTQLYSQKNIVDDSN